jgi:hypothetical protein
MKAETPQYSIHVPGVNHPQKHRRSLRDRRGMWQHPWKIRCGERPDNYEEMRTAAANFRSRAFCRLDRFTAMERCRPCFQETSLRRNPSHENVTSSHDGCDANYFAILEISSNGFSRCIESYPFSLPSKLISQSFDFGSSPQGAIAFRTLDDGIEYHVDVEPLGFAFDENGEFDEDLGTVQSGTFYKDNACGYYVPSSTMENTR